MDTLDLDAAPTVIALPAERPPSSLEQVLRQRRSTRAFAPRQLTIEQLAALLWSALGINRTDRHGRTAPSARDWQEMTVYVTLAEGAYRYDPVPHRLVRVNSADLRALTGVQDFVAQASANLVYVIDLDRVDEGEDEQLQFLLGCDAGCVAQNVYLSCAAMGLATVVRALIDRAPLASQLRLGPHQRIALAQSVGFPAD